MRGKAAIRDQDGVRGQGGVQLVHDAGHVDRPLARGQARGDASAPVGPCARPARGHRQSGRAGLGHAVERLVQGIEAEPGVADKADRGGSRAADLLRLDVEMDQRDALRHELEALGGDLAELAADGDQAVGGRDQVVGDARVAAEQPGGERVRAGDAALAGERVRDRDLPAPRRSGRRASWPRARWMPPPTSSTGRLGAGDQARRLAGGGGIRAAGGGTGRRGSRGRSRNRRGRRHGCRGRRPQAHR